MRYQSTGIEPVGHVRSNALPGAAIILLVIAVFSSACTNLEPISADNETLQQQIRSGQAVQKGDRVRVVTQDGVSHILTVVSVKDDILEGQLDTPPTFGRDASVEPPQLVTVPLVDIPVANIVLLEKETLSKGKTAGLAGGFLLMIIALSAAAALAAVT